MTHLSAGIITDDGDGGNGGGGTSDNYIYTTETHLSGVDITQEPYATQYDDLVNNNTGSPSRATTSSSPSLESVTDSTGHSLADNRFVGNYDNRHDYNAAIRMADQARDCALAYWFTGNTDYADNVIRTLDHWCLDSNTFMYPEAIIPHENNNVVGTVRKDVWVSELWYAASFVRGYSGWSSLATSGTPWKGGSASDPEAAFGEWVRDYHDADYTPVDSFNSSFPLEGHEDQLDEAFCWRNNRYPLWVATKISIGSYLDDSTIVGDAKDAIQPTGKYDTCQNDGSNTAYRSWGSWDNCSSILPNAAYPEVELGRGDDHNYVYQHGISVGFAFAAFEAYDGTDYWDTTFSPTSGSPGTIKKLGEWQHGKDTMDNRGHWDTWSCNGKSTSQSSIPDSDTIQAAVLYELLHGRFGDFSGQLNNVDVRSSNDSRPFWGNRLLGPVTLTNGA